MAPRVNQVQRRADVVDAMWRVIDRDGFGAVSVRSVAAEAGLPKTAITKVFLGRVDMLTCAVDATTSEIVRRQHKRLSAAVTRDTLVRAMLDSIPSSQARRNRATAWVGLLEAAAGGDQAAIHALDRLNTAMRGAVSALIEGAITNQVVDKDTDVARQATHAVAIIDGLSVQSVTSPGTFNSRAMHSCVEDFIDSLITPTRRDGRR